MDKQNDYDVKIVHQAPDKHNLGREMWTNLLDGELPPSPQSRACKQTSRPQTNCCTVLLPDISPAGREAPETWPTLLPYPGSMSGASSKSFLVLRHRSLKDGRTDGHVTVDGAPVVHRLVRGWWLAVGNIHAWRNHRVVIMWLYRENGSVSEKSRCPIVVPGTMGSGGRVWRSSIVTASTRS